LDKHAPRRTIRVTHAPCPWIDDNVNYLMKCRDVAGRLYKSKTQLHFEMFKQLRNQVKQIIRNNKLKFSYTVLNPKLPVKVLWKNIHKFGVSNDSAKVKYKLNLQHINNYFLQHYFYWTLILN
jgi:hypothetical protein